ncbi:hypothetical protein PV05_06601 [Exophiala xenobiotica]|uniref:XRCC4 coiled-coil domain-containing protein n=1 Tax=Exophiala xenobiotica TaxID=348802 RepID=A0A0D2EHV9_9EURO|nr:uncharacterized protein PV05_06601 [Exophiala xenobiotica]KIW54230.1 hypothetical protein PV05_06601 [Exophiala xenobiotica]
MATWVVRLTKADKAKSPILVKVSQKEGGHDLDLDLLATDGDAAYTGKIRQRSLKKQRAQNYDGSDDDWNAILCHVFGCKTGRKINSAQKENLDVTCSLSGKDPRGTLTISLRNKVEDITQQLGSIQLPQTEETDDIDLFGWAIQAIDRRDELEEEAKDLQETAKAKNEIVTNLHKQIDELVKAKAEHEQQMLTKFTAVLNEKKLKIRNLQRVLSTAQADPKKLKELQSAGGGRHGARSNGRRGTKRQAQGQDEESDESEGFDNMDVDAVVNNPEEPVSSESGRSTPEPEDTDDEDEDLDAPNTSESRPRTRGTDARKKSPAPLPPRRELPFQKKSGGKKDGATEEPKKAHTPPPTAADGDEETASEDDEL